MHLSIKMIIFSMKKTHQTHSPAEALHTVKGTDVLRVEI